MKAILLARVSSKEQEEGQSIPAQERRLKEYAKRKGLEAKSSQSQNRQPKAPEKSLKKFLITSENRRKLLP